MPLVRNGRARSAIATVTVPTRAAIYTRKSTATGLDSDFTSLHNQRERAEAYAASQGWTVLSTNYEDPGISGGTMDRPGLQKLLHDIEAKSVDAIIVYRLDRLSRSMVDFVQLHAFLEKHGVALISVCESINTGTPHGRMIVNVLVSFGQYERELASDRTRDKLSASRRKGKFTGGFPVLGFDLDSKGGRLIPNEPEVETVREIFRLFLERRSLVDVAGELNRRGVTLKRWSTKNGKVYGGGRFNRVNLHRMLTNYVYVGKVLFEDTLYDGEHEGIVSPRVFHEVQRILHENRRDGGASHRNQHGALLRGLLRCAACGTAMVHSPTKKGGRVYRYYRCTNSVRRGAESCPSRSIPAAKVEEFVVAQIRRTGADPALQRATFEQALAQVAAQRRGARAEIKRCERDLTSTRRDVERLVSTLSRTTGSAAQAVHAELEKAQERVATLESRLVEVRTEEAAIAAQPVDEADVAQALAEFDEIWSVLLVGERERILKLLIAAIRYDGATGKLDIDWRIAGFGELAQEVGGA